MKIVLSLTLVGAILGSALLASGKANNTAEKKTIKEVMKAANGGGENSLFKKVASGKGTDEENKKLLDLLIDMTENEPPKGDATEWKMAAGMATLNAAKVTVGREGAAAELAASFNCKACHDKFKK